MSVETKEIDKKGALDSMAGKYLTLTLGDEEYGIPILAIQRIIQLQNITPVPLTPDYVLGVINLRGKIIPIIEVRNKFQMESVERTDSTCLIIVQIENEGVDLTVGLQIDAVSEVVFIDSLQIQETPSFGENVETDFITSIAKIEERVIMLLDIEKILTSEEMAALAKME